MRRKGPMDRIRCDSDAKVRFFSESTAGFPAADMAARRLGADRVRSAPAEMLDATQINGDALVVFVQGSAAGKRAATSLGIRIPKLPPSGYRIEVLRKPRTLLVVAGGDLFGMLAGLADALLHGEVTRRAFVYRGGGRTEKPAFPLRYYWTWDHSTNWLIDEPGNQFSGCSNAYLKRPETFVEDYRRLVDHCVEMRFNGIVIWGFLRDAHGGEAYAFDVARYAADRGVAILPGLGTTGYGGVYYEGRHPCNLETYLDRNPRLGNTWKDGQISGREISPYHAQNQEWIEHCVEWLYRSFPLGSSNMENNDLMVDHSAPGRRGRARIKSQEADYFKDQFFAYKTALDVAHAAAPEAWHMWEELREWNCLKDNPKSIARERIRRLLEGEPVDRVPVMASFIAWGAEVRGTPQHKLHQDPETNARVLVGLSRELGLDGAYVSSDNWIGHSALGGELLFPDDDEPMGHYPILAEWDQLDELRVPDPLTDGRMPFMLAAARAAVAQNGGELFLEANMDSGPFQMAGILRGAERLMLDVVLEPQKVHRLLEFCVAVAEAYGVALASTGVDGIQFGDSTASLISVDMYEEFVRPYQGPVIEAIGAAGCYPFLHVCGNSNHLTEALAASGAACVEVDGPADLAKTAETVADRTVVRGNVATMLLRDGSVTDVEAAARRCMHAAGTHRFILSPGRGRTPGGVRGVTTHAPQHRCPRRGYPG